MGLLEAPPGRAWRFAGGPVTGQRALLCADGREAAAWQALSGWLTDHPADWRRLDGAGAPDAAAVLPGARLRAISAPRLRLPGSFDDYLRERSPTVRKSFKQKLRRVESAGAEVREVNEADRPAALRAFLELHHRRARVKAERHPQMDERLVDLLESAGRGPDLRLRVFELVADGAPRGVTVRVDHRGTGYFYNAGIDPDAGRLSPGIVLELASIRDAIARGLRTFDLGPGEYRYKTELGGGSERWFDFTAASPSLRGRLDGQRSRLVTGARGKLAPARRAARRLRGAR
jgi:CelD/BcsL family acetyltransferase involved in cellulose biosynthesis